MASKRNPKDQIIEGAIAHLNNSGPPFASYSNVADEANLSRQLMRYYFPEPDALMIEVCNTLSEAYRQALIKGVSEFEGTAKLNYVLDFYFGMVEGASGGRQQGCNDALIAFAAGHAKLKATVREKYMLMGQALQLEIKVAYPDLSLRTCSELAYACLCILQGNLKLTGSLGMNAKHNAIARGAIDRLFRAAQSEPAPLSDGFDIWS